jgi:hypothetical protein
MAANARRSSRRTQTQPQCKSNHPLAAELAEARKPALVRLLEALRRR